MAISKDQFITELIAANAQQYVTAMSTAAAAQERMVAVTARAANTKPIEFGGVLVDTINGLIKAADATAKFRENLEALEKVSNLEEGQAQQLVGVLDRQTKAFLANAEAAARNAAALQQIQQAGRQTALVQAQGLSGVDRQRQLNLIEQQTFGSTLSGQAGNSPRIRNARAEQAQLIFLENEAATKEAVRARQRQAEQLRASQAQIRQATEQAAQFAAIQQRVNDASPRRVAAQGFTNIGVSPIISGLGQQDSATRRVLQSTNLKTAAIKQQGDVEDHVSKGPQISYLSTLSAIHAASFIATNRTFTMVGSIATLGLAFSRAGIAGSAFGLGIATIASVFNAFATSVQRLEQFVEVVAGGLFRVGAAAVAAGVAVTVGAGKIASAVEDELAVIVALEKPTEAALAALEEDISKISRAFGISAADIANAASQYIRAGGGIEGALEGAVKQVVALQVASKGELVPTAAARSITTITTAFKVGADEAANAIVGLAQKSAFSFTEVTQAFQQAAPLSATLGIKLLDLAAVMGVLANNGLRGQVAGTGFKQVLIDLLSPSDKAAAALQRNNIALLDTNKNLRPLPEIFTDLNRAFGATAKEIETGVRDLSTAGDLVAIFGSRANLAASIIARSGATGKGGFNEMRTAIEGVIATDVANVMLLPTSAQIRILAQHVTELARAFGGPLNVFVGSSIKQFNELAATVGRNPFAAAGQALVAVATGEGFGPIIKQINELTGGEGKVRQFVIGTLNLLLTLRDGAVNIVAPAFQNMVATISGALGTIDISGTFSNLSRGATLVAGAIAVASGALGTFISDIILANERGQEVRNTLAGLAIIVGTGIVGAFALAAIPMAATIVLLEGVGKAVLGLLNDLGKFNSLWEIGWQLAKDSVNNFLKDTTPRLQAFGEFLIALASRDLDAMTRAGVKLAAVQVGQNLVRDLGSLDNAAASTSKSLQNVQEQIATLQAERTELLRGEAGQIAPEFDPNVVRAVEDLDTKLAILRTSERAVVQVQGELNRQMGQRAAISNFAATISAAREEFDKLGASSPALSSVLDRLEGDLPNVFGALATSLADSQDKLGAIAKGGAPVDTDRFFPGVDKAKDTTNQVENLLRELSTSITNAAEDTENRVGDFVETSLNKLTGIVNNALKQMRRIGEDAEIRKADIIDTARIARNERDALRFIQHFQEDQSQIEEQGIARRDLAEQQAESQQATRRGRIRGDRDSDLQRAQQAEETTQGILQQLQERTFSRQQAAQDRAFSQSQSAAERTFDAQLSNAAQLRSDQLTLSRAKTPEDRARAQAQIQQAGADRQFQQQQDTQRETFRRGQETARITFSQGQENVAFRHRIGLDFAQMQFRLLLEKRYLVEKRRLEDQDVVEDATREEQKLEVRLQRDRQRAANRRIIEGQTNTVQDNLEDARQRRQLTRVDTDAAKARRDLATTTGESLFEALSEITRGGNKLEREALKSLERIRGRATERGQDIIDASGGQTPPRLVQVLEIINDQLDDTGLLFLTNIGLAQQFLDLTGKGSLQTLQGISPGTPLIAPQPVVPFNVQPGQPLQAQADAALLMLRTVPGLSPDFLQQVENGVYNALTRAATDGVNLAEIDLRGLTIGSTDLSPQQILQRLTR